MNAPLLITVKFNFNQAKRIPSAVVDSIGRDKGDYRQVPEDINDQTIQPVAFAQQHNSQMEGAPTFPARSNYFSSDSSYGDALRNNAGMPIMNNNHMDTVPRQRRVAGQFV